MKKNYILPLMMTLSTLLHSQILPYKMMPKNLKKSAFMGIEILDVKELRFDDVDGIKVSEISGITYKDGMLYGVGDSGYLYHFELELSSDKIISMIPRKAFILRDKSGKKIKKSFRDSEGLIYYKRELLISFEREHRIDAYALNGRKIKSKKIDKKLRDRDNYRSKNKGLESLCYSKKYGILTAPELPLKGENKKFHTIYGTKKSYSFRASGSLTAMEFMDKNRVLVLQREFNKLTLRRVITLTIVNLTGCDATCRSEDIAIFDSSKGFNIDNFEGLTRVKKNKFLIISDDNDSMFQKTLLLYFKIKG